MVYEVLNFLELRNASFCHCEEPVGDVAISYLSVFFEIATSEYLPARRARLSPERNSGGRAIANLAQALAGGLAMTEGEAPDFVNIEIEKTLQTLQTFNFITFI